jgi:hypothetical protein
MNFFTFLGIFLLLFVFYRLLIEIQDNYENKNEDPFVLQLVQKIRHIDPRVDEVIDHLRFFEGDKSYTLDKKYVFICKKDKKTNEQYHQNQLILVLIHEISHALCDEIGHTPKFGMIFEDLLAKATQQGLYDESIPNVENYCE